MAFTKVGRVIAEAADRRIDILMIGDSNQVYNGAGWDHGLQFALSNKFGLYATGVITAKEVGLGGGVGYGYNYAENDAGVTQNGAPADSVAESYMDGSLTPQAHGYLASGSVTQALGLLVHSPNNGVAPFPADPFDILNTDVKVHFCYGTFDTGAGNFNSQIRLEVSPWTQYATANVTTNTGVEGVAFSELDSTGTRPDRIESRFAGAGQTLTGPFVGYYQRMEIRARTTGISCSTMYGLGSTSLRDMALAFQGAHDNTIWLQLNEARRLQEAVSQVPKVVVFINSGANDRNEGATPSLGPNPSNDPDSAEAYVDNLAGLINRIEAVWNANFTDGNLYFMVVPTHPITPEDAELVSYRVAAKTYADTKDNVEVADFTDFTSGADFDAGGWYDGGGDIHLTDLGYESAATLLRKNVFIKRKAR